MCIQGVQQGAGLLLYIKMEKEESSMEVMSEFKAFVSALIWIAVKFALWILLVVGAFWFFCYILRKHGIIK